MSSYLVMAAIVATLVAVVHSVLGEVLIFRKLRSGGVVPDNAAPPLASRHVRIIWASWHLASVFGLAFAAILFSLAGGSETFRSTALNSAFVAFLGGAILVLVGTRARHPGWVGLLLVAVFAYLSGAT